MRQARLRERRSRGCRVVAVELSDAALAELMRRRLIEPEEIDDPHAMAFAIGTAIEQILDL